MLHQQTRTLSRTNFYKSGSNIPTISNIKDCMLEQFRSINRLQNTESFLNANKQQNGDNKILFGNFDITYLTRENDRIQENIFELFDEVEKGNKHYEESVFKDKLNKMEIQYEKRLTERRQQFIIEIQRIKRILEEKEKLLKKYQDKQQKRLLLISKIEEIKVFGQRKHVKEQEAQTLIKTSAVFQMQTESQVSFASTQTPCKSFLQFYSQTSSSLNPQLSSPPQSLTKHILSTFSNTFSFSYYPSKPTKLSYCHQYFYSIDQSNSVQKLQTQVTQQLDDSKILSDFQKSSPQNVVQYLRQIGSPSFEINYKDDMIKRLQDINSKISIAIAKLLKQNKILKKCLDKMFQDEAQRINQINNSHEQKQDESQCQSDQPSQNIIINQNVVNSECSIY